MSGLEKLSHVKDTWGETIYKIKNIGMALGSGSGGTETNPI